MLRPVPRPSPAERRAALRATRATPLPPDERRRALIEATRPLVLTHGLDVTTRQIAEAAGVAEGTIFRAFETKGELFCAVMQDALAPEPIVAQIKDVPADLDLAATVAWLVDLLSTSARRTRALFAALAHAKPREHLNFGPRTHEERDEAITAALMTVLSRFDEELRVSPTTAACAVKGQAMAIAHTLPTADDPAITEPRMVASLLLNGIANHPC